MFTRTERRRARARSTSTRSSATRAGAPPRTSSASTAPATNGGSGGLRRQAAFAAHGRLHARGPAPPHRRDRCRASTPRSCSSSTSGRGRLREQDPRGGRPARSPRACSRHEVLMLVGAELQATADAEAAIDLAEAARGAALLDALAHAHGGHRRPGSGRARARLGRRARSSARSSTRASIAPREAGEAVDGAREGAGSSSRRCCDGAVAETRGPDATGSRGRASRRSADDRRGSAARGARRAAARDRRRSPSRCSTRSRASRGTCSCPASRSRRSTPTTRSSRTTRAGSRPRRRASRA